MKNFIVEGVLTHPDLINDDIMKEHMAYSQKAMDEGLILMSGLKSDMNGGLFIMRAESIDKIIAYLDDEPFKVHGIQEYKIIEFNTHYLNQSLIKNLANN